MTQTNNGEALIAKKELLEDLIKRMKGVYSEYHKEIVSDELTDTLESINNLTPISKNKHQEAVTNLWEALGKWSAYLASNGEQANLAPPSWLIDAVSSATSPPKQMPDGWKPIETAPKGESVLVAGGDCNYPCVANWSGHHEDVWCVDGQMDSYAEIGWPAYWMALDSLPALPTALTNTEVGE